MRKFVAFMLVALSFLSVGVSGTFAKTSKKIINPVRCGIVDVSRNTILVSCKGKFFTFTKSTWPKRWGIEPRKDGIYHALINRNGQLVSLTTVVVDLSKM
jgi:hypothetical protein